ncbi:MAG: HlyU family transcriptional regulator [Sedimenticola sp.]|nr:HlyU family transcriptional regulator [Sedimenticola sp.]
MMGLFSFLKSMVSSIETESAPPLPAEEYKGFQITPDPLLEEGQYRVRGTIQQGEQTHAFIRADQLPNRELCAKETLRKARVLIDQQGSALFK